MRQRLYQTTPVGTADQYGRVSLTFPPVPQGSAWTGSVSLFAAPRYNTVTGPGGGFQLINGQLDNTLWWLQRNASPILQMSGGATAVDVQCVGQETLTVIGSGMDQSDTVVAVWSGWSDDMVDAPFVEPYSAGVVSASQFVYNGEGRRAPLTVAIVDDPARTTACRQAILTTSASSATLFTPGLGATSTQIQSLALQVVTANSGSTAQAIPFNAMIQTTDGTNITNLLTVATIVTQASCQEGHMVLPMDGLPMPDNQSLQVACSSLAAGNSLRVQAAAVLTYVAPTP